MADPVLGSEGSELTNTTQLAYSVGAQGVEPVRMGIVGQSLNQSSVWVFGSVLIHRAEMIHLREDLKHSPESNFVSFSPCSVATWSVDAGGSAALWM